MGMDELFKAAKLYPARDVLESLPFKTTRSLRAWATREGIVPRRFGEKTVCYLGAELNEAIARSAGKPARPPSGAVGARLRAEGS